METSCLGDENLLVLGKKHIKTICLPIHPLILQFLSALHLHPMQLTPNSLKFLVASIILNEVKKKNITVEDLLFVFSVKRTPTKPSAPKGQFDTYYLSASKNYYIFFFWECCGGQGLGLTQRASSHQWRIDPSRLQLYPFPFG